jgi:hypothetical protein
MRPGRSGTPWPMAAHALIAFALLIGVLSLSACGRSPVAGRASRQWTATYPLASLDSLMLADLARSRVVMLGDAAHGLDYYERLLLGALDAWVDTLQAHPASTTVPNKLLLFLELSPEQQAELETFFTTGDIGPIAISEVSRSLRLGGLSQLSTDRLAYYSDLRELVRRIETINARTPNQISLQLACVEPPPPAGLHTVAARGWEEYRRQNYLWFATKRDSLLAARVLVKLRQNPEAHALFYYGTAHLQRGPRIKPGGPTSLPPRTGFFLVHYLDAALGQGQVRTFMTRPDLAPGSRDTIRRSASSDTLPDYEVLTVPVPPRPCPLLASRSRRILDWAVGEVEAGEGSTDTVGVKWVSTVERVLYRQLRHSYLAASRPDSIAMDSLRLIGRERAEIVRRGGAQAERLALERRFVKVARRLVHGFDAVENIRRIGQWADSTMDDSEISLSAIVANLPANSAPALGRPAGGESANESGVQPETTEGREARELMQYLAVNLLALGTADEQAKAMAWLRESTGLPFRTPPDWRRWWREQYAGPG